jgi:hypothetical protein
MDSLTGKFSSASSGSGSNVSNKDANDGILMSSIPTDHNPQLNPMIPDAFRRSSGGMVGISRFGSLDAYDFGKGFIITR